MMASCAQPLSSPGRSVSEPMDWEQLHDALSANGVRFDGDLRARLTRLCRKDITDVESLHGFVERVAERVSVGYRQRPSKRWYAERVQKRDTRRRSQK